MKSSKSLEQISKNSFIPNVLTKNQNKLLMKIQKSQSRLAQKEEHSIIKNKLNQ
jgi:hypothetical protein